MLEAQWYGASRAYVGELSAKVGKNNLAVSEVIFTSTNKTKPFEQLSSRGLFLNGEPGDYLLSHEIQHTIIGVEAFHCPVRDGKEWFHPAMASGLKRFNSE